MVVCRVLLVVVLGLVVAGCKRDDAVSDASAKIQKDPLGAAIVNDATVRGNREAARAKSASNLRRIGGALIQYGNQSDTHRGPASLADLLKTADLSEKDVTCPLQGVAYKYKGYRIIDDEKTIVVYEVGDPSFCNVLFGDGSVKPFVGDEAKQIEETGKLGVK